MKKVICVVAAFAMVAGVATVASAEVKLGGDARARFRVMDSNDGNYIKFDSRVRVKIKAKTESGAYAQARLRFFDGTWGDGTTTTVTDAVTGVSTSTWAATNGYSNSGSGSLTTDYGYLGFKANGFDVSAGRQLVNWSEFFSYDGRADRLKVLYKTGGTTVGYTYDQVKESYDADDEDIYKNGVLLKQKVSDTTMVAARLVHVTNDTKDTDGFVADAYATMNFGGNNVRVEAAYKDSSTIAGDDNGMGAFAAWSAAFGAVTPKVRVGMTADGYQADTDFGWLMIGDIWGTSTAYAVGEGGDTLFAGVSVDFAASEKLSFQGNVVYLDVDSALDDTVAEISGQARYQVIKDASLTLRSGTLSFADSSSIFNTVLRLDVKF